MMDFELRQLSNVLAISLCCHTGLPSCLVVCMLEAVFQRYCHYYWYYGVSSGISADTGVGQRYRYREDFACRYLGRGFNTSRVNGCVVLLWRLVPVTFGLTVFTVSAYLCKICSENV